MTTILIQTHRPHVDAILGRYADAIGPDLAGYRNHVYRAITYAMHFLGQAPQHARLVETAFAYHDIGLWTDRELAYLEPSEAVALADNQTFGWGLDPEALRAAIHWHHKVFPYRGPHGEVVPMDAPASGAKFDVLFRKAQTQERVYVAKLAQLKWEEESGDLIRVADERVVGGVVHLRRV